VLGCFGGATLIDTASTQAREQGRIARAGADHAAAASRHEDRHDSRPAHFRRYDPLLNRFALRIEETHANEVTTCRQAVPPRDAAAAVEGRSDLGRQLDSVSRDLRFGRTSLGEELDVDESELRLRYEVGLEVHKERGFTRAGREEREEQRRCGRSDAVRFSFPRHHVQ
jgi:hypothetical protein